MTRSKAGRRFGTWLPLLPLLVFFGCLSLWFATLGRMLWHSPLMILVPLSGIFLAAWVSNLVVRLLEKAFGIATWVEPARRGGPHTLASHPDPGYRDAGESMLEDRAVEIVDSLGGYATWLLRDGALVEDVASGWRNAGDDRFRIARTTGHDWLLYDAHDKCLHAFAKGGSPLHDVLYALIEHQRETLDPAHIAAILERAEAFPLQAFRGLWLRQADLPAPPPEQWQRTLRNGHVIEARLLLPADLRTAAVPDDLVLQAKRLKTPYALYLDGQPAGLHTHARDPDAIVESDTGRCIALPGCRVGRNLLSVGGPLWHVLSGYGWQSLHANAYALGRHDGPDRYDINCIGIGDDGTVAFELAGARSLARPPRRVDLPVGWQEVPLRVPVRERRFAVSVPAGAAGAERGAGR